MVRSKMKLSDIIDFENKTRRLLDEKINAIVEEIKTTKLEGVNEINKNCFSMKLSALENGILSADYYSQTQQAEYINAVLRNKKTATEFKKAIETIVEKGCAEIGSYKYRALINKKTIEILKKHLD